MTAEEIKKELSQRLHRLLSSSGKGSTSGVARQVRHTGVSFSTEGTTVREANKAVVETVKADVRRYSHF